MSGEPYTPRASLPEAQAAVAAWYAAEGVTQRLVLEPLGYRLAVYRRGVEVPGGLAGLSFALRAQSAP